jgi:hypothetical protein
VVDTIIISTSQMMKLSQKPFGKRPKMTQLVNGGVTLHHLVLIIEKKNIKEEEEAMGGR